MRPVPTFPGPKRMGPDAKGKRYNCSNSHRNSHRWLLRQDSYATPMKECRPITKLN
jgi:hypothetical protein